METSDMSENTTEQLKKSDHYVNTEAIDIIFNSLIDRAIDRSYDLLHFAGMGLVGIIFFISGITNCYDRILFQYDQNKVVILTTSIVGAVFMSFAGIAILYNLKQVLDRTRRSTMQHNHHNRTSTAVESATVALVRDIIKKHDVERESRIQ